MKGELGLGGHVFRQPFVEIGEGRPSNAHVFQSECVSGFTIEELVRFLGDAGFCVTYDRHVRPGGALEGLGFFFATRE